MVGGEDYASRPFNLATQGQRQPGSAFKPFVLATALERGIAPGSVWASKKLTVTVPGTNGKEKFVVNNYEDSYLGVREPRRRRRRFSDNSVYVQVGMKAGLRRVARDGQDARHPHAGLAQPRDDARRPEARASPPLDMAHAYSRLAAGGRLRVTGTLGTPRRTGRSASATVCACATTRPTSLDRTSASARASCPTAVAAADDARCCSPW